MSEMFGTDTVETNDAPQEVPQVDYPAAQALLDAQNDYQRKTSGLLETYYRGVDGIRDKPGKIDLPFPDVLTDEQKAEIIASQEVEAGQELHQKTATRYEEAVDEFAKKAEKHTAKLRADLFNVGDGGSAALSQAVGADEVQLIRMIELGELTGDPTIAKAAFAAGVVRGDAPQAVRRYLDANPHAEPLLRAYKQAPQPEWFETTKANITPMIKPPTENQLRGRSQVGRFG